LNTALDNPPPVDAAGRMEIVRELCSFEGRLTGTDAERRAANRLAERLRALGRRAEVEPTYVHPQVGVVHAGHCLIAFAGSLVAISSPVVGSRSCSSLPRRCTSTSTTASTCCARSSSGAARRTSSRPVPTPGARARLVICAHVDAARSGAIYDPRRARRAARLSQRSPVPLGFFRVVFWSLALLLPLLGARMAGLDSNAISVLQLFPTLVLLVAVFALVEIELSEVSPGANDNASGIATAISLAAELDADPPANLDVWVVLDGGEECQQEGMRRFVRAHRKELDREHTFFLAIDSVGGGDVRFETSAGWVVSYAMDRRLIELCTAIAAAEPRFKAAPLASGIAATRCRPRLTRLRSIGITCRAADGTVPHRHLPTDTPDAIDRASLERAHAFSLELVRRLDADLGRHGATGDRSPRVSEPTAATSGELLWTPSPEVVERSNLTAYVRWLAAERGLDFGGDYTAMWRWSVDELEDFWATIWELFEVRASAPYARVLGDRTCPVRSGSRAPNSTTPRTCSRAGRTITSRSNTPRSSGAPLAHLGRAAGRGRPVAAALRRLASSRETGSSPTCPTSPRR
jgi:acetylornithine deacetylase/succinyl-diaminopimelate desuccinylase-like protein